MRPEALLEIGEDVGISGGSICAAISVRIGSGTLLGANVTIADTNFHPLRNPERRYAGFPEPSTRDAIHIGENVFIGAGAMVLRGADIGDNAVIGAGSVVRGRVSPGEIVLGNPAISNNALPPPR